MKTESLWKFTFDPAGAALVLCDYRRTVSGAVVRGDLVEGELRLPLARSWEVVPLLDSAAPFLRLGKNSVVTFKLDVFQDVTASLTVGANTYGPDIAARVAMLDSLVSVDATIKKPLNIQLSGYPEHYWQFAACGITQFEPERILDCPKFRLLKSYSLTCCGFSKVTGVP